MPSGASGPDVANKLVWCSRQASSIIRHPIILQVDALVREDDVDTLKTAIVVVLLLAVLYGVYVTLNQPEQEIPEEIAWAQQQTTAPLQVEFAGAATGSPSGVTASLGDSAAWSSDPTGADSHGHDHAIAGAPPVTAPDMAPAGYGQSHYGQSSDGQGAATAAPTSNVAAPDLITAAGGTSMETTNSAQPASVPMDAQAYGSSAPTDPAGATSAYGTGNTYQPNSPADVAASQTSTASNNSIYSPSANGGAPTGNYGESSGLSGNAEVVAETAPPVANSYEDPAPDPGITPVGQASRVDGVIQKAQSQIEQGQYYEALFTMSLAYNAPGMSAEENQQLQPWLDPLAGKVIYSKEHLIGAAYPVQAGETLQSIAEKHSVPWQLLANINGLRGDVQPGTSIKVVPGPFHAEVDLATNSLTLFVGRLYAGRFPIQVNGSNLPTPGEYRVNDKQPGHSYYAGNAQTLAPEDPQNPYGGVWIDLGGNVSLHATSKSPGQSQRLGSISLADNDANDLYGILSLGSNVVVRR